MRTIKPKRCAICHGEFTPFNSLAKVCSVKCSIEYANKKRIAKERTESMQERRKLMERKEAAKPLKKWLDEAQDAINRWVREVRDEGLPCISCGRHAQSYDAGHLRTRKAASHLRFTEDNIWRQCSRPCNHDLSGNLLLFRKALVEKIGIERVEALENDNTVKRWTIEEAKEIKRKYNKLYNEWRKSNAKIHI